MNNNDEWSLKECVKRGSLPNGECIDALYGAGPWSTMPDEDVMEQYPVCDVCGNPDLTIQGKCLTCPECGWSSCEL